jgi:tetratricopeptide (TPR) repeat protein
VGNVQEELGNYDEAEQSYLQSINSNPGAITGYIALANLQLSFGETEKAINTINEGITQAPGDYRGYQALGDLYAFIEPENIEQAVNAYHAGIEIVPGSPQLYVKIANLHYNIVSDFWDKLEQAAEYETAAENRYEVYLNQFDFGEGSFLRPRFFQRRVDRLIQTYEQRREALRTAQYRYNQTVENYSTAETNYTMALSLDQNYVPALIGLGRLRLARGLTSEGVASYEMAYAMNPFSSSAAINLGNYYTEIGEADKAVGLLETVIEREPTNMVANNSLSIAYHNAASLSISQAARSVEQSVPHMEALITRIREK